MQIGKTQILKVSEKNSSGYMLVDDVEWKAFLPKIFVHQEMEEGEEVEAFIYQDDDKLKATTEKPLAEVGEFAVMNCVQILPTGAFMDWELSKICSFLTSN